MKIRVDTKYEFWGYTEVELPEGRTVDDIINIYMKWGVGSIEFKDGTIEEGCVEENHDNDHEYFKRPETLTFEEMEWEKCEKCEEKYYPEFINQTMCDDCENSRKDE